MQYQYVALHDARIAYRVSGTGPALVLMKNNRRPPDYPVAELLSRRFRVLQIHPVGFGASDRPEGYDFGSIGEQVLAVLDHEGIDRFAVWGFSQPAAMSAVVARSTGRAAALVMGGFPPIGSPTDGEMRRMEREPRLPRPPLEFWRHHRSYDWHHELRCFSGTKGGVHGHGRPSHPTPPAPPTRAGGDRLHVPGVRVASPTPPAVWATRRRAATSRRDRGRLPAQSRRGRWRVKVSKVDRSPLGPSTS